MGSSLAEAGQNGQLQSGHSGCGGAKEDPPQGGWGKGPLDSAVASGSPSCPRCPFTFIPTRPLLDVPQTRQAHSCPRAFAQAGSLHAAGPLILLDQPHCPSAALLSLLFPSQPLVLTDSLSFYSPSIVSQPPLAGELCAAGPCPAVSLSLAPWGLDAYWSDDRKLRSGLAKEDGGQRPGLRGWREQPPVPGGWQAPLACEIRSKCLEEQRSGACVSSGPRNTQRDCVDSESLLSPLCPLDAFLRSLSPLVAAAPHVSPPPWVLPHPGLEGLVPIRERLLPASCHCPWPSPVACTPHPGPASARASWVRARASEPG